MNDITTWMGILRAVLSAIGGAMVMLGYVDSGQVADWTNIIVTSVGALVTVGVTIWSTVHHTTANNPDTRTIP